MTATVLAICLLCVPATLNATPVFAQRPRVPAPGPNPHRHPSGDDFSQIKSEIKIVSATVPPDASKENMIANKARTFRVFTISSNEGFERIFFEDRRAHKTYEIEGVAWPGRPLNDPVCVGDYLIFDRSVNPNRSMHYGFNLRKRVVTVARVF
jgi:hypothetical protein